MPDLTQILNQIESGDPSAADQLLPLVYDELRKLAAAKLANEKPGQTLQATGLVHEAYLRLVGGQAGKDGGHWNGRAHFFGAVVEAMRRILVDKARHKRAVSAGGNYQQIELTDLPAEEQDWSLDLIALSDAMEELEQTDSRAAELVKLRFFAGLTRQQAASVLGISLATADNDWAYAKGWLKATLSSTGTSSPP